MSLGYNVFESNYFVPPKPAPVPSKPPDSSNVPSRRSGPQENVPGPPFGRRRGRQTPPADDPAPEQPDGAGRRRVPARGDDTDPSMEPFVPVMPRRAEEILPARPPVPEDNRPGPAFLIVPGSRIPPTREIVVHDDSYNRRWNDSSSPFKHDIGQYSRARIDSLISDLERIVLLCRETVNDEVAAAIKQPPDDSLYSAEQWDKDIGEMGQHADSEKWIALWREYVSSKAESSELRIHLRFFMDRTVTIHSLFTMIFAYVQAQLDQSKFKGDDGRKKSINDVSRIFPKYIADNGAIVMTLKDSVYLSDWHRVYSLCVRILNNISICLNDLAGHVDDIDAYIPSSSGVGKFFKFYKARCIEFCRCIVMEASVSTHDPLHVVTALSGDDELYNFKRRVYEMLTDCRITWKEFAFGGGGPAAGGGGPGGGGDRPEREVPRGGDGDGDGRGPAAGGGGRRPERAARRDGSMDEIEPAADGGERRPERAARRDGGRDEIEPAADGGERRPERAARRDGDGDGDGGGPAAGGGGRMPDRYRDGGWAEPGADGAQWEDRGDDKGESSGGGGDDSGDSRRDRETLAELRQEESDIRRKIGTYRRVMEEDPDRADEMTSRIRHAETELDLVQEQIRRLQPHDDEVEREGDEQDAVLEMSENEAALEGLELRIGRMARNMTRVSQAIVDLKRDDDGYARKTEELTGEYNDLRKSLERMEEDADELRRLVAKERIELLAELTEDVRKIDSDSELVKRIVREINTSGDTRQAMEDLRELVHQRPEIDRDIALRVGMLFRATTHESSAYAGATARLKAMRSSPGLYKAWLRASLAESYPTT